MSEHAKNLRAQAQESCCDECETQFRAASYIEALEAENALLRRSLELLTKQNLHDLQVEAATESA